jgi:hypothetical protein
MYKDQRRDEHEGIIELVKETADGFGHLLAEHVKLARLELVADIKTHARQVAVIALIVPLLFIGYALVCVGVAIFLSQWLGRSAAFFLVGGLQIVLGGLAIAIVAGRLRRAKLLNETASEVNRSVATLTAAPVTNGASTTRAPREIGQGKIGQGKIGHGDVGHG